MKRILISLIFCCMCVIAAKAQILLKNNQGEQIFAYDKNLRGILLNLNTGNTSLGIDYFFNDKAYNPSRYHLFRLGVSSKATDGVSSLVKGGEFSTGLNLNGSYTKIGLFAPQKINHKFSDWLELKVAYSVDKYKLFNGDTTFKEQITSKRFDAYNLGGVYNFVLGSEEQNYFSFGVSIARKSNYSELSSIEIQDYKSQTDPAGTTERRYGTTQTAKQGKFKMFDAFPLTITYTHLPRHQWPNELDDNGEELTEDKKTKTTQIISSKARRDTIIHITKDRSGNEVKTEEIIEYKPKSETVTIETTEKVKVVNPLFKSLKTGYAIFMNSDFTNTGDPTQSRFGGTIFLVSPNKEGIYANRIGITSEITDVFDARKANNGPLKRINIGLTVNFSL